MAVQVLAMVMLNMQQDCQSLVETRVLRVLRPRMTTAMVVPVTASLVQAVAILWRGKKRNKQSNAEDAVDVAGRWQETHTIAGEESGNASGSSKKHELVADDEGDHEQSCEYSGIWSSGRTIRAETVDPCVTPTAATKGCSCW